MTGDYDLVTFSFFILPSKLDIWCLYVPTGPKGDNKHIKTWQLYAINRNDTYSHQALKSFGFSGSPSHATSTGKSYGSKITRN